MTGIETFQEILSEDKHTYIDPNNLPKLLKHLQEEVNEFIKAKNGEEASDIIILLCMCANKLKIDLGTALWEKLSFNIKDGRFKPKEVHQYGLSLACSIKETQK